MRVAGLSPCSDRQLADLGKRNEALDNYLRCAVYAAVIVPPRRGVGLPVCVKAIAKVRNFVTGRAILVSRPYSYLNFTMAVSRWDSLLPNE